MQHFVDNLLLFACGMCVYKYSALYIDFALAPVTNSTSHETH